ncbi:MAG: stage II sporulation protein R [Oscillospiraceae bacterium]|nr:stage II sporulation protein R [Oscillospiraceae bacterium]
MKKNTVFIAILGVVFLLSLLVTYARGVQSDIARQVLRLHVVANSNSDYDQQLKYAVRDRIVAETASLFENSQSPDETKQIAADNIEWFQSIAQSEVALQGFSYEVAVSVGIYAFPATVYGDILLPAGRYDALKIAIGNGGGENWWCVLFPPLCFIDGVNADFSIDSRDVLRENLSERDYALITGANNGSATIQVRFRILELLAPLF